MFVLYLAAAAGRKSSMYKQIKVELNIQSQLRKAVSTQRCTRSSRAPLMSLSHDNGIELWRLGSNHPGVSLDTTRSFCSR